ncbi:MAG: AAA family ATPase [Calditrichia bacterium]|nr:AAA family ATPase [Calditrichia bacterium]
MQAQPGICMSLLGGFCLCLGEREISEAAFQSRKALNLIKLLSIAPKHQLHRDQILDTLWPSLEPLSASAQLYKAIHYARKVFESADQTIDAESILQFHKEILSLTAPDGVHTDVNAFRNLVQEARRTDSLKDYHRAVACYGGDLLPADLYERWTEELRESLRLTLIELLLESGQKSVRAGYLADAADAFRRALSIDQLNENAHQGLMRVFALQGTRSQALHQYKRCCEIFSRELDITPSLETTKLYEDIRDGKIVPGASFSIKKAPLTSTVQLPKFAPLIGRQEELKAASNALDLLSQGKGSVLIVEGMAGIGKTRLAQEFYQLSQRRGFITMLGCAYEEKNELPYSPVVEALRMAINQFGGIPPSGKNSVHLLPAELTAGIPEFPAIPAISVIEEEMAARGYLFAGLLRFLKAVAAEAPVVMILEDLHLADDGTLNLFMYLARNTADFPFLLLGTFRSGEIETSSSLAGLLSSLNRGQIAKRLALPPLSKEQHQKLLAQNLARGEIDVQLAAEIFSYTEGNPLFAIEMLDQLKKAGKIELKEGTWKLDAVEKPYIPGSLQILLAQKWNQLSQKAQSLLNVIAVAGQQTSLILLESISDIPAEKILDLLDEMFSLHLLKEAGLSFQFVHPLIREALYQQMSYTRRRYLHETVARTLGELYENDPQSPIEAISGHFLKGGDPQRALPYLIQAGDRAAAMYAHEVAIGYYRQALDVVPSIRNAKLLEKLGDQLGMLGREQESAAQYESALSVCNPEADSSLRRKAAYRFNLSGDLNNAWRHIVEGLEKQQGEENLEWVRWQYIRAHYHWQRNEFREAFTIAQKSLKAAERLNARDEITRAYEMMALCCVPLGEWQKGLEYESQRLSRLDLNHYLTDVSDVHL